MRYAVIVKRSRAAELFVLDAPGVVDAALRVAAEKKIDTQYLSRGDVSVMPASDLPAGWDTDDLLEGIPYTDLGSA